MYKGLYEIFKHWFHGGQVWFYSDPHFSDEEMVYLRKNYIGDEEQVRRINSKIGKCDTIIFLGDIGDTSWIQKIRGYKVLIKGNHDSGTSNYVRQKCWRSDNPHYDNHLFDEVYDGILTISDKIILSHEPIHLSEGCMLNIHGHDHSGCDCQDGLHLNVCAEHINYTPISLKSIIESGRLGKIESIHRSTIDEATARKKRRSKNI